MTEHRPPEMILNTSPEAATYRTDIKGWVSRTGRFFGEDERAARYDGCTHVVCDCGASVERGRVRCQPCQEKLDQEDWLKLPLVEWDGAAPLCLFRDDEYFFSLDDVEVYCDNHDLQMSTLQLVVCAPTVTREVDSDYWCDDLPEDGELPPWLEDAVHTLNAVIREHRCDPLSWYQGKERVVLTDEREES